MNTKKIIGFVLTGALTVSMIGGTGAKAFAATSSKTSTEKQTIASLDTATKEKVEKVKTNLKTQLASLGVTLPERGKKGDRFVYLYDATKVKAEEIAEKEKAGTITHEEAKAQLQELGVTIPEHGRKVNLDETSKAKAEVILEKQKAGAITHEEAKAQLQELGVSLPNRGDKGEKQDFLANLDEETNAKAAELIDNAKAKLEELGVKHSNLFN